MSKEGSVAPKERINIKYRSHGDKVEEKELPLKLLAVGDFTLREDDTPVEDRKAVNINKLNFDDVLKSYNLSLDMAVANEISEDEKDSELGVKLKFNSIKDFNPDSIVEQVDELKKLKQLREALVALKSPLGNVPKFRRNLQSLVKDKESLDKLCQELGIESNTEK
ncbi:type VI secretion system contractile sheath small subunit [Francisella philomiragia]|uniref:Type VI secretion system contractile sheath small subunit n=1 Tax=Francisella philomiragia TaxID=28110 RepID=A0ABS1GEQ3_9GAMM|nr:type VI secretion system contractile sheath small subunit [Francisella philomiragia]MBK2259528.1 type VI secretion system contractile sheath small subunit [Francisella philomiragia]MBK2273967.1 type VI secretion system contractile sheath small subunit [Francisella philomiragia]MBK2277808.1 type VI secretion system contractile sheath small subunit [Francisella philomiragia]MBK2279836.1 type VI secretion system contractile sheath small subunit [Francisella philomiragia]